MFNLIIVAPALAADANASQDDSNDPCKRLPSEELIGTCRTCMYGSSSGGSFVPVGFWTGIGCLSTNPIGAISQLLTFLMGISSVFIFAQILIGAFTLMTSRGDPKGVQDAKSRITNSVIALLFILFSVTILQFIGVNILKIPGFFSN